MGWLEEAGLSDEFVEGQVLVPGGAFRQKYQFNNEGYKSRYFFVLNKTPSESDSIVLVTSTTKITKAYRRRCYRLLVKISPKDYPPLTKESVVDCTHPIIRPKTSILGAIQAKKVSVISPLPAPILASLRKAIGTAKTIEPWIKALVLGEEDNDNPDTV